MTTPLAIASSPSGTATPASPERIASVDALRGLVITLMIFVNDVAGVTAAPGWLKHATAREDAMTLPDIVFPCFLFIAGISIPLALDRALAAGASRLQLWRKVLGRTVALLVMGVLMVNAEEHNPWSRGAWGLLAYVSMLLAFVVVTGRPGAERTRWRIARAVGWIGLIVLALLYRAPVAGATRHLILGPLLDPTDPTWLRHSWWGILGLIGWAYLTASTLYLVLGRRREWLVGATGLLFMLYVAAQADLSARLAGRGWLDEVRPVITALERGLGAVNAHVSIGGSLGSLAAISLAGVCLGSILVRGSGLDTPAARLRWAGVFTAGLLLAAVLFDPLYGLNKIRSTPSWGLLCAAIAAAGWMLLYWQIDLRGRGAWTKLVRPAGANPLLAYLLHPLLYLLAGVAAVPLDFYHRPAWPLAVNIGGSFVMAIAVVQLTGLLARTGYRLKA
jgi:predicted acyltransferase